MPDNVLLYFAKNEAQYLTFESFHLLKSEFEVRNLKIEVLEDVEIDKSILEIKNQLSLEDTILNACKEVIWNFILDERAMKKTKNQIIESLVNQRVLVNIMHY